MIAPPPTHVDGTSPYPWPFDADLDPARAAVLVLGWDAWWWDRAHEPASVVPAVLALAAAVGCAVVVEHRPPGAAPASAPAPGPPPVPGAHTVVAAGIDAFYGSPLDALLRSLGRDHLYLVGLGLETTVHSTMRSANDRGLECLLVVDACAPLDPALVPAAVSMVEMSGGIFGAVGATDPVLAALRPAEEIL